MSPTELTVIGGTGANIAMMDLGLTALVDESVEGHRLSRDRFHELRHVAAGLTPGERVEQLGVPERRADVMIAGLAVLDGVLEYLGLSAIRASRASLRHGVLDSLWRA